MDLSHGDKLDTLCRVCREHGEKTPSVDWTEGTDGTRYYVCETHATELTRYGAELKELPDTPRARPCVGCGKMTLERDLDPSSKRCAECRGPDAVVDTVIQQNEEGLSVSDAVDVLDRLIEEGEEEVPAETAADALERLTGVEMVTVEDAEQENERTDEGTA